MPLTLQDIFLMAVGPFSVFMLGEFVYGLWPIPAYYYQFDTPLHWLGGASMAVSVFVFLKILERHGAIKIKSALLQMLLVLITVMAVAVAWEMYEFVSDIFYGTPFQTNNWDTMKDLIVGSLGGATASAILVFTRNKKP